MDQTQPPVIPVSETNCNKATNHKTLTAYQPFPSKQASMSALSSVEYNDLEHSDVCPYVWMDSIQQPIRMPCCNKPFGKAYIIRSLAHDIDRCPNCTRECCLNSEWHLKYAYNRLARSFDCFITSVTIIILCVLVAYGPDEAGMDK